MQEIRPAMFRTVPVQGTVILLVGATVLHGYHVLNAIIARYPGILWLIVCVRYSLLASLYNPIVNPAMVSTVRFYDRNELYESPDVRNCRMPNFLG